MWKEFKRMRDFKFFCLFVLIAIICLGISALITKAIWESDMPTWLKLLLLK